MPKFAPARGEATSPVKMRSSRGDGKPERDGHVGAAAQQGRQRDEGRPHQPAGQLVAEAIEPCARGHRVAEGAPPKHIFAEREVERERGDEEQRQHSVGRAAPRDQGHGKRQHEGPREGGGQDRFRRDLVRPQRDEQGGARKRHARAARDRAARRSVCAECARPEEIQRAQAPAPTVAKVGKPTNIGRRTASTVSWRVRS